MTSFDTLLARFMRWMRLRLLRDRELEIQDAILRANDEADRLNAQMKATNRAMAELTAHFVALGDELVRVRRDIGALEPASDALARTMTNRNTR